MTACAFRFASALGLGLALIGQAGSARAADIFAGPDRYEAPPILRERPTLREQPWPGRSVHGPIDEADGGEYDRRYADGPRGLPDDDEEEALVPPAPVGRPYSYPAPYGRAERYDRRYAEERVIVERPHWQRPVAGRLYGGQVYGRQVEDCRIIIRRRVDPFGDVVIQRRRICD